MINTHNLQVSVRNTFLHVDDPEKEEEKAHELTRSRSVPSISSSSAQGSGVSDIGSPKRRPERPDQSCPIANPLEARTSEEPQPDSSRDSSCRSSSSGFYDHVASQEQQQSSSSSGFYDHVASQEQQHKDETQVPGATKQHKDQKTQDPGATKQHKDETQVPGEITGPAWSTGAELHHICQCKPCTWYWRPGKGCLKGANCQFCHMCDSEEVKSRRKNRDAKLKAENQLARDIGSAEAKPRKVPQHNHAGQATKLSL